MFQKSILHKVIIVLEENSENGFECLCRPGFSGGFCEKTPREGGCHTPGVCGEGTCVELEEGDILTNSSSNLKAGFRCQCPFGRAGPNCGIRIKVSQPKFNGKTSFVGLPRPKNILRALSISFKFKPISVKDSVVMYCGQSPEGQGDFAAITIKDKHVEFRYDTGTGELDFVYLHLIFHLVFLVA